MNIHVIDNFLKDPEGDRRHALSLEYEPVVSPISEVLGYEVKYSGMAGCDDQESKARISELLGVKEAEWTNYYRHYYKQPDKETYIHNDARLGTFTTIIYLSESKHCSGGTALWRHRATGWTQTPTAEDIKAAGLTDTPELFEVLYEQGFDESLWEMVDYVPMEFNRMMTFHSPRFHSRYPQYSFGDELENSRLIKVFFCKAISFLG